MALFQKKLDAAVEREVERRLEYERNADEQVDAMAKDEIDRRKWAISTASCVDDLRPEKLISTAQTIYEYVWGKR